MLEHCQHGYPGGQFCSHGPLSMEAHGMTVYRGRVPVARAYGQGGLQDGEWSEIAGNGSHVEPQTQQEALDLARLIAVAPEMLEACKAAMKAYPDEMRGSLVEAAVAKTEGKGE